MVFLCPPPTTPSMFDACRVSSGMASEIGDIRNLNLLKDSVLGFKPDIVFHLAAQPLVRESYDDPVGTYMTNVMGTVNLLESVRQCPSVRAVVCVTSDKCYENNEWDWGYRENDPMGGYDPYSNSKGCSELVCSAFRSSYFSSDNCSLLLATGRAGNVIGGGDWADFRLVPDVLKAFSEQRELVIRNPGAIRPWQHVLEPLKGYLMLAEKLFDGVTTFASGWNFGPDNDGIATVKEIVDCLSNEWGGGVSSSVDASDGPHEANILKLDVSKARAQLGWRPAWTLEKTLAATVNWYRAYLSGHDMRATSLRQIEEYIQS